MKIQLMSFLRKQESREGEATSKDKEDYTYDKNGNLIKKVELDDDGQIKRTTLHTYNYENRLTKVEIQKGDRLKIVAFTYDPFGRRLSKSVYRPVPESFNQGEEIDEDDDDKVGNRIFKTDTHTDTDTYYVYDNEDIIMEYNQKGKVTARYVHGLGIDEPLAIERKGEVYYYHADGLGSITSLMDKKQKVVESYEYDSFGNLKRKGDKVKNTFTYTGREWDKEIELYYYRARYYDAKVGRFIGKDPILNPLNPMTIGLSRSANLIVWMAPYLISSPKSLHPYIYVGNAPTMYTDSTGLIGWDTVIKQVLKQIAKKLLKEGLGDPLEKGAETERQALEQFYLEQYKRCLEGCGVEGRCDTEECKAKCSEQYTRDMERLQKAFR